MNREILKSMDTGHIPVQRLTALLETFTLKHAARMLPDLLETADLQDSSCREFLLAVLETEVKGRNERRRKRNYSAAHFPPNIRPLEEFDPEELESGITHAQLSVLKELSWLDNCGNLVFAGPPGLGKTMVACGLGLQVIITGLFEPPVRNLRATIPDIESQSKIMILLLPNYLLGRYL